MLPEKFLSRMKQMLGEEYSLFLQSYDAEECHALRKNPLKSQWKKKDILREEGKDCELWQQRIGMELTPVPWNREGFYYTKENSEYKKTLY